MNSLLLLIVQQSQVNLIEDMLFGHEKGAFTGAGKGHKGLLSKPMVERFFLDEIGDMPIQLQSNF